MPTGPKATYPAEEPGLEDLMAEAPVDEAGLETEPPIPPEPDDDGDPAGEPVPEPETPAAREFCPCGTYVRLGYPNECPNCGRPARDRIAK